MDSSITGLSGFLLTCLIMELTPGPNMGYLALISARYGRKVGFITVSGIASGLFVLGMGACFGLSTAIAAFPSLYTTLRWAGCAYMLWLAWHTWRNAGQPTAEIISLHGRYFRRGLVSNLLNPKALVFYFTVIPQFIAPATSHTALSTFVLMSVSVFIATLVHCLIVIIASPLSLWLNHADRRKALERVFALLLAGIALWLMH